MNALHLNIINLRMINSIRRQRPIRSASDLDYPRASVFFHWRIAGSCSRLLLKLHKELGSSALSLKRSRKSSAFDVYRWTKDHQLWSLEKPNSISLKPRKDHYGLFFEWSLFNLFCNNERMKIRKCNPTKIRTHLSKPKAGQLRSKLVEQLLQ